MVCCYESGPSSLVKDGNVVAEGFSYTDAEKRKRKVLNLRLLEIAAACLLVQRDSVNAETTYSSIPAIMIRRKVDIKSFDYHLISNHDDWYGARP